MAREISKEDLMVIDELAKKVIKVEQYNDLRRLGGLTNRTYSMETEKGKYIIRIPGEGTEELICRADEKISTELACKIGIDAKLLYFGEDGTKVTEYISEAKTMSKESLKEKKHIRQAAQIFSVLHKCGVDTGIPFEVFDMAANYEKLLEKNQVQIYADYNDIKENVMYIKSEIDRDGEIVRVPCHNDPLCENWVEGKEGMFLIDWEYAGMNDGMWDLADLSIEADYNKEEDAILLESYLGHKPTRKEVKKFWANKIYLDYLWTLWGKTRVPFDGEEMEQYALERYIRLKENLRKYREMKEEL